MKKIIAALFAAVNFSAVAADEAKPAAAKPAKSTKKAKSTKHAHKKVAPPAPVKW